MNLTVTMHNGIYRIMGRYVAAGELDGLLLIAPPLRLDLSGLKVLNSIGICDFGRLMREWGDREIEFHHCSTAFVDAMNVIPGFLGNPPNPRRVKSVLVPMECGRCGTYGEISVPIDHEAGVPRIPEQPCPNCQTSIATQIDPDEYFFFMTAGD